MPRNIRNFWIELEVDGRSKRIETGPKTGTGGFDMVIRLRENGTTSDKYMHIRGNSYNGKLEIRATECNGKDIDQNPKVIETDR